MSELEGRGTKAVDGMLTGVAVEVVKVWLGQWLGLDPITLAALAGGLTPLIEGLSEPIQRVALRRAGRVQLAAEEACRCANCDLDELVRRSLTDEGRIELFSRALEAAQRSVEERQIRALGRVLGVGVSGDGAKVDEALRVVRTLADMDPADLRVLALMATGAGWTKRPADQAEHSKQGAVAARLPGTSDVVDSIFARLETLGLISDEGAGLSFGTSWYVTEFGRLCLRKLEG